MDEQTQLKIDEISGQLREDMQPYIGKAVTEETSAAVGRELNRLLRDIYKAEEPAPQVVESVSTVDRDKLVVTLTAEFTSKLLAVNPGMAEFCEVDPEFVQRECTNPACSSRSMTGRGRLVRASAKALQVMCSECFNK
jgi:hypothetical protein